MVKASPAVRSFNSGVFSPLMEGRTDYERYPSAMHQSLNCIVTPQGPAICRSGTKFVVPAYDHGETSTLISMIISNEQGQMIEFAKDRIRFLTKAGIQVYTPVVLTLDSIDPITFTSADLAANIGDEVALGGFPAEYNLNGEIAQITGKAGTVYTLDISFPPTKPVVAGTVARVYHVACAYTEAQRKSLRAIRDVDYLYLLTRGARPRKLTRFGPYDWRLEDVEFVDGPYMPTNKTTTRLTPAGTGNAIPDMTANNLPAGVASGGGNRPAVAAGGSFLDRTIPYAMTATDYYMGFSADDEQYWASSSAQGGQLIYEPAVPFAAKGYTIHTAKDSNDLDYIALDYAPSSWTFQGFDGTWHILDQQDNYVLIENDKTVFFPIDNNIAYTKYRIVVKQLRRNGRIEVRIRKFVIKGDAQSIFTVSASSVLGINRDTGFRLSDVGRLLRMQGEEGAWRALKIVGYTSPTVVTVQLLGEPFLSTRAIKNWRLGYWSEGTGWPSVGDIWGQRLYLFGSDEFPNLLASSFLADYEYFAQTGPNGEVTDEHGFAYVIKMEHVSRFRWASSDERGLLLGSGRAEHAVASSTRDDANITAANFDTRITTRRGSADVEPVRIDQQVVFAQRGAKTMRELSYSYDSAGYRTLNLSKLASHVTAPGVEELDYSAEPYGTVWGRLVDGMILAQTYDQEESVQGWHVQNFGGIVESEATLAEDDVAQDTLWMEVRRTVNGVQRRYIEYMTPPWEFGMTLADAHYVDSGLRYEGAATSVIYGLQHLEGQEIYGLADYIPFGPKTVVDGSITLDMPASLVIAGLGFDSIGETMRLENGQQEGTAQGKTKRIGSVKANVWDSACGQFGVWNEEQQAIVWEDIEFPQHTVDLPDPATFTGVVGPLITSPGWDKEGRVAFRRPKETPLPFNVVAILPQLVTEDAL